MDLTLVQQPSWSALRDRLAFGQIDFAHMLSPMPVAATLGLGGAPMPIDTLMVLSVNGTVIGVSDALAQLMAAGGWRNRFDSPESTSAAVLSAQPRPVRIGVPFAFSMHRLLVEYWLSQDPGFTPDKIDLVTVPPPQMGAALDEGRIDMFCVGEPWGSVAVQQCGATLVLPGAAIWSFAPEKVLGAHHDWVSQHPETCCAMVRAVYKAAQWLEQPHNIPLAVEILAQSAHLDLPDQAIEPALTGRMTLRVGQGPVPVDRFMAFHDGAANFPWQSQARWIAQHLSGAGNTGAAAAAVAAQCFRPDLYRAALAPMGVDLPEVSSKVEGAMRHVTPVASTRGALILGPDTFFDGAVFDFDTETALKN